MKVLIVLTALLAASYAQLKPEGDEGPKPYSFSYVAEGEEGASSHQEVSDGSGTVRGSYTLKDIDGRNRVVEYVAGPDGFTANIKTNEPGTDNISPANVVIESTAENAGPARYSAPAPEPVRQPVARPVARPVAEAPRHQGGVRYVLVPVTDPRARDYHS